MHDIKDETVLIVCSDAAVADELLQCLFREGVSAVGPVENARTALAIATHTHPTVAVIASPPTGRRGAVELAQVLKRDWGIGSWILDDAVSDRDATDGDSEWLAHPQQIQGLRRILGRPETADAA